MTEEMNNELELAAQEYQHNHCPMVSMDELSIAFKAGANWQKEQDMQWVCDWLKENVTYTHPRKGTTECIVNLTVFKDAWEK